jgi:hypothetical protein
MGTLAGWRLWLLFFGEYESPEGVQHRDRGREKKSAKKACVEQRKICQLNIRTMPDKDSPSVLEFITFVLVYLPYAFKTQSIHRTSFEMGIQNILAFIWSCITT